MSLAASITNPVLRCLNLQPSDKIIAIKENGNIDSNFVITHILKKVLSGGGRVCMVILHNTIGHYQNVGKKLGYDFVRMQQDGFIATIEPLKDIVEEIGAMTTTNYFSDDKERIVGLLFGKIRNSVDKLCALGSADKSDIYLIIDDLSHLLDLGIDLKYVLSFVNYCISLVNLPQCFVVISTHVCCTRKSDEILCNNLNYISDVNVEVVPLKTGLSREVTGLLSVERTGLRKEFHFKAFDKGIKTFHLGECVYNLYK